MSARYVMIGGFLGAGKTTAVDRLARRLADAGERVGLITNDQSSGLVDSAILRSRGFAVEEIAGGCFCCRFDSLQDAANKLDDEARPDVFLAEPVGSCTDLLATVSYPLRRIYGDRFRIAPLSVLVDPGRAERVLGLADTGRAFSEKVVYVYKKQLEEAEVIVVNKSDALDETRRAQLVAALEEAYPKAEVFCVSAKTGEGLDAWFERILEQDGVERETMELDYRLYAEGEALLGWLNATYRLESDEAFDGNRFLMELIEDLRGRVDAAGGEIAHLKATLDSGGPMGQLSVVSVVGSDREPDLRESLIDDTKGGALILNLRAEQAPEELAALVEETLQAVTRPGLRVTAEHEERFRPAPPEPTHRIQLAADEEGA